MNGLATIKIDTCLIDNKPTHVLQFTVEQHYETFRSLGSSEVDPEWTYVDPAGHFHAYDQDGRTPTLIARDSTCFCPDHEEEHDETRYFCFVCDAEVAPGRRSTYESTTRIPLPREYTLVVAGQVPNIELSVCLRVSDAQFFGFMRPGNVEIIDGNARTTLYGSLAQRKIDLAAAQDASNG